MEALGDTGIIGPASLRRSSQGHRRAGRGGEAGCSQSSRGVSGAKDLEEEAGLLE